MERLSDERTSLEAAELSNNEKTPENVL